ncbi:hypothetical protein SPRG_01295 [Saprolegnia parasitica CBS 223.65]|uniref:JmjC domain-containing protein n=1 Tax=Saprolegnia parasitica (strain CBS 223.65) TaxID=695850 RepID=A0A067D5N5_SAPPC|nr:hypothetical protein SPRG_01295 [Saprolegnia parasitica CBS 223.65]KDO34021.1 hypothetical protein SPRG_01295 [Saprolegnia parasitica CBS 223.65]|eukprot:XP_012194906.1 hypothetical protein SPRG_01295 [Saprolegnia parasitica CBS 223.65]
MALASLSDQLKVYLTLLVGPDDLLSLAATCKVWYIFANEEPLWETQVLRTHHGDFAYKGSWKTTYFYPREPPTAPRPPPPAIAILPESLSSDFLQRRYYRRHMHLVDFVPQSPRTIPRMAMDAIAPSAFSERYGRRPVMLTDGCTDWPALPSTGERKPAAWTLETLVYRFGDVACRVTHNLDVDVDVRITLADYEAYVAGQHDETPLYIFDPLFGEKMPSLLDDYALPPMFRDDLLDVLGTDRPEFRWLVAGPARSGAPWHLDPVKTSAWNALLVGRKRWAMYPPDHPPPGVELLNNEAAVHMTSLEWYLNVYPTLAPEDRPYEVVQEPGETIYVPSGWWHLVLNLDFSVAVTQNFVDASNLGPFLSDVTRTGDLDTLSRLESAIATTRPGLSPFLRLYHLPVQRGYVNESAMVRSFTDTSVWAPSVRHILSRHDLLQSCMDAALTSIASAPLRALTAAVNPVFVVHDHVVLKWFSSLNRQWADCDLPTALTPHVRGVDGVDVITFLEAAFVNECLVYDAIAAHGSPLLQAATPTLLARGTLHPEIDDDDVVWRWPYLVLSYNADDVSVATMLARGDPLSPASWSSLVDWLGDAWFPAFHALPVPSMPSAVGPTPRNSMQWYTEYLGRLRAKCVGVHLDNGVLPDHLMDQMDAFVPSCAASLVLDVSSSPVLLHGDLTAENVLGRPPWTDALRAALPPAVASPLEAFAAAHQITSLAQLALEAPELDGLTWPLRRRLLAVAHRAKVHAASFLFADEEEETSGEKEPVFVGGASWAPTTVLDFADMKTGDAIWDLVPVIFSLLHGDVALVRQLLRTAHWAKIVGPHRAELPLLLMRLTLLHPSQSVTVMLERYPAVASAATWTDAANLVFGPMLA